MKDMKLIFVLKLPPPIHGSTKMNLVVARSEFLANRIDRIILGQSISSDFNNLGRISVKKLFQVLSNYLILTKTLLKNKEIKHVYFSISPYGSAFIKDFFSICIIKFFKKEILFHLHGKGMREWSGNSKVKKWIYRKTFKSSNVICLAKELVFDVQYLSPKKIYIVPNGIEELVTLKDIKNRITNSIPNIVFLSNFIIDKGILVTLKALSELKCNFNSEFTFSIVGKNHDITADQIKSICRDLDILQELIYIGPLYDKEKFDHLLNSDILVFPTYYKNETFGLVLLEAMQCALPVITCGEGGIPSVVDNRKSGFIVNSNDSKDLCEKLDLLVNNRNLRIEMGLHGRYLYESNFTIEKFEQNLYSVIENFLQS